MFETEIRQVLIDQQKDIVTNRNYWISRDQWPAFVKNLDSNLIKVIMGIRRAGKSTLALQAAESESLAYVNFDDERLTSLIAKDLNLIYETLLQIKPDAKYFVFDEIQNVDHWELFINRLKRKGLNLIITGSNGKLLSRDLASHLTGRHLTTELMPFSFAEFLRTKGLAAQDPDRPLSTEERAAFKNHFEEYFRVGGFPEVVQGESPHPYLRELFGKIVSRDITQRYDLRTPRILKELALYLIQQSGSLTSLQKLMEVFKYKSVNTLRKHLGYLQDAYLLYELSAYSNKIRERSTAPRKNYACDIGLINALNSKPVPDLGMRLETLVFLHFKRLGLDVYYLKSNQFDIDFAIVEDRKVTQLVQVCYELNSEKTRKREIDALFTAARVWKVNRLLVITWAQTEEVHDRDLNIDILPCWEYFWKGER